MLLSQLTTVLSLLSGACLPTGWGRPGPQGSPPQPWAATNQTPSLDQRSQASPVPSSALSSWKAFLDLQKTRRMGRGGLQHEQEEATASLPLDPQEVARERCKAVPFTQVGMWWEKRRLGLSIDGEHDCGARLGTKPCILSLSLILSFLPYKMGVAPLPASAITTLSPKSISPVNGQRHL